MCSIIWCNKIGDAVTLDLMGIKFRYCKKHRMYAYRLRMKSQDYFNERVDWRSVNEAH